MQIQFSEEQINNLSKNLALQRNTQELLYVHNILWGIPTVQFKIWEIIFNVNSLITITIYTTFFN